MLPPLNSWKKKSNGVLGLSKGAVAATPSETMINGRETLDMKLLVARMLAKSQESGSGNARPC